MAQVDSILAKAVEVGASDVHLSVGSPPTLRLHGRLVRSRSAPLTRELAELLVKDLLGEQQREELARDLELDFAYELKGVGRFRCNAFHQHKGVDLCFRVIRASIPTLEELGLPEGVRLACDNHQGLILVTGGAGTGKSTTLAALVDFINTNRPQHVLTVEDPIEHVHPQKLGVVNQRQLGAHTRSYANALKAALRENPDVIVVGDLRDLETIALAISASETGHLVIGSMNTSSAAKTVDKIIDSYPAGQQNQVRAMLGESLKAVFTQRLLPRADGKGVALAYELLLGSRQLANLIRDGKTFQISNLMQTGRNRGMRLMDDVLLELLAAGTITREVALRNATNLKLFQTAGAAAPAPETPLPAAPSRPSSSGR